MSLTMVVANRIRDGSYGRYRTPALELVPLMEIFGPAFRGPRVRCRYVEPWVMVDCWDMAQGCTFCAHGLPIANVFMQAGAFAPGLGVAVRREGNLHEE